MKTMITEQEKIPLYQSHKITIAEEMLLELVKMNKTLLQIKKSTDKFMNMVEE